MKWAGETDQQWRRRVMSGFRRFALVPAQMVDGQWVWLEHYWSVALPDFRGGFVFRNGVSIDDAMPSNDTHTFPPRPQLL